MNLDESFLFAVKSVTGVCKVDKNTDVIDSKQLFKFTAQRSKHSFNLSTTIITSLSLLHSKTIVSDRVSEQLLNVPLDT